MKHILILLTVTLLCDACGFGMLGGGGGGGCGGGCGGGGGGCAPQVGGCGRKKRSVIEPQVKTELSEECPQTDWKEIIDRNLQDDIRSSKVAIQGELYRHYESRFMVVCTPRETKIDQQFVSNGEGYCGSGNQKVWCLAILMMG